MGRRIPATTERISSGRAYISFTRHFPLVVAGFADVDYMITVSLEESSGGRWCHELARQIFQLLWRAMQISNIQNMCMSTIAVLQALTVNHIVAIFCGIFVQEVCSFWAYLGLCSRNLHLQPMWTQQLVCCDRSRRIPMNPWGIFV